MVKNVGVDEMKNTSSKRHEKIRVALDEIPQKLASGELNGSGRFFSDEELAPGRPSSRSVRLEDPRSSAA
jgi:hypothetical protein